MKTRIITAVLAIIIILVPCFVFLHSFVLPLILGLFSAIAVYEIINATGGKNKVLLIISCLTAAAVPFAFHFNFESDDSHEILLHPRRLSRRLLCPRHR